MMHSRNLIYFFNIVLSLFFLNIHFINGTNQKNECNDIKTNQQSSNSHSDTSQNEQNENSIEQSLTSNQNKNYENKNKNENNNKYIYTKNNQVNQIYSIEKNTTNYTNNLLNNRTEDKREYIEEKKMNNDKGMTQNSITHKKKINFTITILRNNEILDDIKIDNIVANEEGCFILDFKNCKKKQLKRFIGPITSIIKEKEKVKGIKEEMEGEGEGEEEKKINEEKKDKQNNKQENEENKNENKEKQTTGQGKGENNNEEENPVELKVEEVGVPQQKEQNEEEEEIEQEENNDKGKRNQNNIENNDKGEVDEGKTDKKETKNKNKKEINDKDEMETNIQKKDIKYEVLLIRNVSSDKNGKWKKGKNNNNSESLVNYISSNGNMKDDKDNCYKFEIHNGDRLIIEIYDDKFKEKIDEYHNKLSNKFRDIFTDEVTKAVKDYKDIYKHYDYIENIKTFISIAKNSFNLYNNELVFLYHKYKIIKEIYDLFDKLNKKEYLQFRKIIENEINDQNKIYNNKNNINEDSQAIFNIDSNIKDFIDSISILKLHKEIYDEENNNGEIEQYKPENKSFCNSCKRRVYMSR